jgi:hypothetical protein
VEGGGVRRGEWARRGLDGADDGAAKDPAVAMRSALPVRGIPDRSVTTVSASVASALSDAEDVYRAGGVAGPHAGHAVVDDDAF